jgi:signal transduction histidine kinase
MAGIRGQKVEESQPSPGALSVAPSNGSYQGEGIVTRQRELERMQSEYLAKACHELRTPLFSIQGAAGWLRDGKVPDAETRREFLDIIYRESQRLGKLVNDLLDISAAECGGLRIDPQPMSLGEAVLQSIAALEGMARERGVTIETDLPATLPAIVADRGRVEQVLTNLVSNAVKFSREGGKIVVKVEDEGDDLLVQVRDGGIGIPAEAIPRVFERFYRVSGSMTPSPGGTGLGLYIAKQIVEGHGGRIWAESEPGRGSTFGFTLPLHNEPGSSPAGPRR